MLSWSFKGIVHGYRAGGGGGGGGLKPPPPHPDFQVLHYIYWEKLLICSFYQSRTSKILILHYQIYDNFSSKVNFYDVFNNRAEKSRAQ